MQRFFPRLVELAGRFLLALAKHGHASARLLGKIGKLVIQCGKNVLHIRIRTLRELAGARIRIPQNGLRLAPGEGNNIFLSSQHIGAMVRLFEDPVLFVMGGTDDLVAVGARLLAALFRLAHEGGGAFQLDGEHVAQLAQVVEHRLLVNADLRGVEEHLAGIFEFPFHLVDDVESVVELRVLACQARIFFLIVMLSFSIGPNIVISRRRGAGRGVFAGRSISRIVIFLFFPAILGQADKIAKTVGQRARFLAD